MTDRPFAHTFPAISAQGIQTFLAGFGLTRGRATSRDNALFQRIKALKPQFAKLNDAELRAESLRLRERTIASRDQLVDCETAFALLEESLDRTLGIRLYDVQLLGGLSMLRNEVAEMQTGEGKTFVGVLTAYARALEGHGVHFMTTNAYLAQRDHVQIGPVLERLGMTVGLLDRELNPTQKRDVYQCDVTYGPGYEFGFDYLRDQLTLIQRHESALGQQLHNSQRGETQPPAFRMQRGQYCAIIDEADSVLIDEATTPLVLSGAPDQPSAHPEPYLLAHQVAEQLTADQHFTHDTNRRRVSLTQAGRAETLKRLESSAQVGLRRPWHLYVEQALQAEHVFARDAEYVVRDDKIKLVDSNTGRIFDDRTWSDGLHQAVEAKEGIVISEESSSLARISRQQYFRLYENMCGMTGTASDAKAELQSVYGFRVTRIPTHRPCQRVTRPLRSFTNAAAKWDAIARSVAEIHGMQRPILIGTRTIEASETIASRLGDLPFQLLNGIQDADEAQLIASAGQLGAITIATNMAGRGTDIQLADGVAKLGGLHVIVTEPHDSARVDLQLIGRAARQGDPGSCQTFASAEDQLIRQHAPWLARHIKRLGGADGETTEDLTKEIVKLQRRAERKSTAQRRAMFGSESWLEAAKSTLAKK